MAMQPDDVVPLVPGYKLKTASSFHFTDAAPSLDHYRTQNGVLGLRMDGDLVSTPRDFSAGRLPLLSGLDGFYVEFDIRLSVNDPDHWPAVWLMPAEHDGKRDHYDGDGGFICDLRSQPRRVLFAR